MGICSMIQGTQTGAVTIYRSGMGRKVGGRFRREGTHVDRWLTHVDVRQKPAVCCKAINLQLKRNTLKK